MSEIKKAFRSRFHEGWIVEVDWNQLEVVILQVESGDPVLAKQLRDGIDLHTSMTAAVHNTDYDFIRNQITLGHPEWVAHRKKIKSARFALQYGAGAAKIAETAGTTEEWAREFTRKYYDMYPVIYQWQKHLKKVVVESAKPSGKDGEWKGQYISPNGRRYIFTGNINSWGKVSFPPNKLYNYPIQGLASDFVKMMRSDLITRINDCWHLNKTIFPINTIHDSVMFDVSPNHIETIKEIIDYVYSTADKALELMLDFRRKVEVPLKWTIKSDHYWS